MYSLAAKQRKTGVKTAYITGSTAQTRIREERCAQLNRKKSPYNKRQRNFDQSSFHSTQILKEN
jgi:hypothetical protein